MLSKKVVLIAHCVRFGKIKCQYLERSKESCKINCFHFKLVAITFKKVLSLQLKQNSGFSIPALLY